MRKKIVKSQTKFYKTIEDNPENEFANDILYVNNVSLIGFGASRLNAIHGGYGTLYLDVAVRLDDFKTILKLVFMYELEEKEFSNLISSNIAYSMPDRGITGYLPVMVIASDSFIKDRDEYYLYAINGRDSNDFKIYTISFDIVSMSKIYYLISLMKQAVFYKKKLNFMQTDKYDAFHTDNTRVINLAFTNDYHMQGFVVPPKKLFEKSFSCLCLTRFSYGSNTTFNLFFFTEVKAADRKTLKHSPWGGANRNLLNNVAEENSFLVHDSIDVYYYNKGAEDLSHKIIMIGNRRDGKDSVCFIFSEDNYKSFVDSVSDYMRQ